LVDAVEKVGGMPAARSNRIVAAGFLNRPCAFDASLESILLGDPSNSFFNNTGDDENNST
jgi:hypothetical protein